MPLTVVSGSWGAGKTTLLDRVQAELSAEGNEPIIRVDLDGPGGPTAGMARLRASVRSDSRPAGLLIDNLHRLDRRAADQLIAELLNASLAPSSEPTDLGSSPARVVVATRARSALSVARYRPSSSVVEVDEADLRLGTLAIGQLLMKRRLPDVDLAARVFSETEGWPYGVAELLDRLDEQRDSPDAAIAEGVEELSRAMVEDVASTLDPTEFDVLLRTSIASTLDDRLCRQAVDEAVAIDLTRLTQSGVFMRGLDRTGERFQLHRLLRHGLRRRLEAEVGSTQVAGLHQRYGAVAEADRQWRAAVDHYLAGGEAERAADVVAKRWAVDRRVIPGYLDRFEGRGLEDYVPHIVTVGLVHGQGGDAEGLSEALERLALKTWNGPLPHGFATLDIARVELAGMHPTLMAELSNETVATLSAGFSVWPRGLVDRYAAAHFRYFLADFDQARQLAQSIVVGHRAIGRHSLLDQTATVLAFCLLALLDHDAGRTTQARRYLADSRELATEYDLPPSPMAPVTEVRELTEAVVGDEKLDRRIGWLVHLAEEGSRPNLRTHAGTELVRLLDRVGRYDDAVETLAEVTERASGPSLPAMLSGRLARLERALSRPEPGPGPSMVITLGERSVLQQLAGDLTQDEIGEELGLSINTVKSHLRGIYQKFGVTRRQEAVAHATEAGLLATVLPWISASGPQKGPPIFE